MVGHDDDLMLRLNAGNCASWKQGLVENEAVLHTLLEPFQSLFLRLATLFGESEVNKEEAVEMCSYLKWADLHNVELSIEYAQEDLTQCNQLDVALETF